MVSPLTDYQHALIATPFRALGSSSRMMTVRSAAKDQAVKVKELYTIGELGSGLITSS